MKVITAPHNFTLFRLGIRTVFNLQAAPISPPKQIIGQRWIPLPVRKAFII
jgi:hypothetical protein